MEATSPMSAMLVRFVTAAPAVIAAAAAAEAEFEEEKACNVVEEAGLGMAEDAAAPMASEPLPCALGTLSKFSWRAAGVMGRQMDEPELERGGVPRRIARFTLTMGWLTVRRKGDAAESSASERLRMRLGKRLRHCLMSRSRLSCMRGAIVHNEDLDGLSLRSTLVKYLLRERLCRTEFFQPDFAVR